jgi:hypothetical protein
VGQMLPQHFGTEMHKTAIEVNSGENAAPFRRSTLVGTAAMVMATAFSTEMETPRVQALSWTLKR